MTEIVRIAAAEAVLFGVVKVSWQDGYEAVVDLRPVIDHGDMFAFLRASPKCFDAVRVGEGGHSIYWLDDAGDEIDFGTDSLRKRAERQAELLRVAS